MTNDRDDDLYLPEVLDNDDYEPSDEGSMLERRANDMITSNQRGLAHELSAALIANIDLSPTGFLERIEARGKLKYLRDAAAAVRGITGDMRVAQSELNNTAKDILDTYGHVYSRFRQFDIDRAVHPYARTLAVLEGTEKIQHVRMRMTNQRGIAAQQTAMKHVAERAAAKERPENQPMTKEEQVARQAVIRGRNGTATVSASDLYTAFAALTYHRYVEGSQDSEDATERAYADVLFMVQTKGISEAEARGYAAQFADEKKRMDAAKMSKAQGNSFAAQFRGAGGKK